MALTGTCHSDKVCSAVLWYQSYFEFFDGVHPKADIACRCVYFADCPPTDMGPTEFSKRKIWKIGATTADLSASMLVGERNPTVPKYFQHGVRRIFAGNMSQRRHCSSAMFGLGCSCSPANIHEHKTDAGHEISRGGVR